MVLFDNHSYAVAQMLDWTIIRMLGPKCFWTGQLHVHCCWNAIALNNHLYILAQILLGWTATFPGLRQILWLRFTKRSLISRGRETYNCGSSFGSVTVAGLDNWVRCPAPTSVFSSAKLKSNIPCWRDWAREVKRYFTAAQDPPSRVDEAVEGDTRQIEQTREVERKANEGCRTLRSARSNLSHGSCGRYWSTEGGAVHQPEHCTSLFSLCSCSYECALLGCTATDMIKTKRRRSSYQCVTYHKTGVLNATCCHAPMGLARSTSRTKRKKK